jgi:UPF0755 protein
MRRLVAPLLALLVVALLVALAAAGARRVDARLSSRAVMRTDFPVIVEIPRGSTASAVARQLETERLVADHRLLRLWLQASGEAQRIQAGEYAFEKPMNVMEIGELLVSGKVVLHAVTVPEGLTLDETAARMAASGLWTPEALRAAFLDPAPIRDLDPSAGDLEGYLFPDTYHFPKGEPAASVARAMAARFEQAWGEAGGPQLANGRTVRQVASLAALVEEETGVPEERPIVASVYWNRLQRGMRLEADPTVIFALQKAGLWTGGPLLLRDLAYASAYNTYMNAGLPPGPIASFGILSLRAALQPATTDYYFFVATGTGGHHFAATMKEHEKNVALYRQALKEREIPAR